MAEKQMTEYWSPQPLTRENQNKMLKLQKEESEFQRGREVTLKLVAGCGTCFTSFSFRSWGVSRQSIRNIDGYTMQ